MAPRVRKDYSLMVRPRLPQISCREMNDLRRCVEQLMGARASLKVSQAKESAAVCAIIESTIMVIGPLYDRCEPAYEAIKARAQERQHKARERGDLGQILRADKIAARMGGDEG